MITTQPLQRHTTQLGLSYGVLVQQQAFRQTLCPSAFSLGSSLCSSTILPDDCVSRSSSDPALPAACFFTAKSSSNPLHKNCNNKPLTSPTKENRIKVLFSSKFWPDDKIDSRCASCGPHSTTSQQHSVAAANKQSVNANNV